MSKRPIKISPRVGDIWRAATGRDVKRRVTNVAENGTVSFVVTRQSYDTVARCSMSAWYDWCRRYDAKLDAPNSSGTGRYTGDEAMSIIAQAAKDCERTDCMLTSQGSTSTCMGWTPTYDKLGNRTDDGDPNILTDRIHCHICGRDWFASTQYGKTDLRLLDASSQQKTDDSK